ncbi:hypothetical protein ACQPW1_10675 [Nocardia sp. CA-128927]|uniref:hypothetical protein n=1 Tax=Nocardia sp. CA-128927 TaxID=3239975 RepID=UPI003D9654D8
MGGSYMVVPHEVPLGPGVFVNREPDFQWVDGFWSGTARVDVCTGLPGVGKTAFVRRSVEKARAASMFTDGDLHVDFGVVQGERMSVEDALAACLTALGVATEVLPASLASRANLLRSKTADVSVLIVLENVTDPAQVTPFIPIGPASAVLVTSSSRLSELIVDGAAAHHLEPLDGAAGAHLITELVGARARADTAAVAMLVRQCAGLPVALKIVAAKLIARPGLSIASVVTSIAADERGLAPFSVAGWDAVAAVFSDAYVCLDTESARLYRLLSVYPGRDLTTETAAVLADRDVARTDAAVDVLIEAGLLIEDSGRRLSLHPRLRRHATQLSADVDTDSDREDAARRFTEHLLVRSVFADRAVLGTQRYRCTPDSVVAAYRSPFEGDDSYRRALEWLDGERMNLLAVQRSRNHVSNCTTTIPASTSTSPTTMTALFKSQAFGSFRCARARFDRGLEHFGKREQSCGDPRRPGSCHRSPRRHRTLKFVDVEANKSADVRRG